jgi:hypothetical protein
MITEENKQQRQSPFLTLPLLFLNCIWIYLLKSFFLAYPASPINPEPRRNIVAGSGMG